MKFNITEEEKRNILMMHKSLISEQVQTNQSSSTTTAVGDKEYCVNIEKKMDFDHPKAERKNKFTDFKIRTYPDHSKSDFGSLTFTNKTYRGDFSVVLYCSGPGTFGKIETTDYNKLLDKDPALTNPLNQLCRRVNTCYPSGNKQS